MISCFVSQNTMVTLLHIQFLFRLKSVEHIDFFYQLIKDHATVKQVGDSSTYNRLSL